MAKTNNRVNILKAAAGIVREQGILALTLEAAASKAGVSKGGLLHHFPSKEKLIQGMVEHLNDSYVHNIRESAKNDQIKTGRWTRSFIQETNEQLINNQELNAGMLAALSVNPELLRPFQDAYKEWQESMEEDGLNKVNATILRLAADGLWLSELFGLAPLEDNERHDVLEKLIKLSKEDFG
ncbi:TetR/AcrR family transcriptional regulator [Salibacterium salarium]|uniref:TetR/AcrR family transcriptional regulator n=1 Tax=Salibacterium salarium TaxID=284579 RepID=A0A428N8X5_9BACI|nr:TetR/AcrR family transcriptional regulator [Salibacterium salarium]RSL34825.1 TetR/AcrR family transcriptional regulator [Salibacterium salarium]